MSSHLDERKASYPDFDVRTFEPFPVGAGSAGQPVTLPHFYMPYRARVNRHAEQVRVRSREWAQEQGLIGADGWDAERFDGMDLAGLCASMHPDAAMERLTLVTWWYIWLFFLDDFYPETLVAPGVAAERVLARLWSQTQPLMSADWCRRFAESTLHVMDEHSHEQANTALMKVPGPLEYAAMRRLGSGGKWSAELTELATGGALVPVIAHSLAMRELIDCFGDIVRLHNDIVSYNRETQQEHEVNNAVLVVEAATGSSPQQAVEKVNDTLTVRLRHFEHITAVEIRGAVELHHLGLAERETVIRYASGLEDSWQATTSGTPPACAIPLQMQAVNRPAQMPR
jgi:germacradienol/geosmin synthase